ncbi:MAG: sigma-70 family RNA polymerase sigma factor [Pseudomonadota bacterium]
MNSDNAATTTQTPCSKQRFNQLILPLAQDMQRYALSLSRDPELAQDVVQEAMLRAWRKIDGLRDESSVKAWLLTIVRREFVRQVQRRRVQTVDIDRLHGDELTRLAVAEDHGTDELQRAIGKLNKKYRQPLAMQALLGYSAADIAEKLGLRRGAVLTRLFRARQQLRVALAA